MVGLDDDVDVDVEDDLNRDNVAQQPTNQRIAMANGHWPSSPQAYHDNNDLCMIITMFSQAYHVNHDISPLS